MSNRLKANRALLKQIASIHQTSYETYGSPRVFEALKDQGVSCGKNRVARLMHQAGLQGPGRESNQAGTRCSTIL